MSGCSCLEFTDKSIISRLGGEKVIQSGFDGSKVLQTCHGEGTKCNGESNSLIAFRIRSIHYALKNTILRR